MEKETLLNSEKVLVCITAQENSQRLIDKACVIAEKEGCELHILNVQQGNNIFNNKDLPRLLQNLFIYGSQRDGIIHALCHENVPECIAGFAKNEKITKLVLGEPPKDNKSTLIFYEIVSRMPKNVDIILVKREEE